MSLLLTILLHFVLNTLLLFATFVLLNSILDKKYANWRSTLLSFLIVVSLITLYLYLLPVIVLPSVIVIISRGLAISVAYTAGRNINAWVD